MVRILAEESIASNNTAAVLYTPPQLEALLARIDVAALAGAAASSFQPNRLATPVTVGTTRIIITAPLSARIAERSYCRKLQGRQAKEVALTLFCCFFSFLC